MSNKKEAVKSGTLITLAVAVGVFGSNAALKNGQLLTAVIAYIVALLLVVVDRFYTIGTVPIGEDTLIEAIKNAGEELDNELEDSGIDLQSDGEE